MAADRPTQSYATHRRWHPPFHFIAVPILALNIVFAIVQAVMTPGWWTAWNIVVAIALLIGVVLARWYAIKLQNRLIKLEETIRLGRCLPDDLRARIGELSTTQLVSLRFCADDELPDLTREVLAGNLRDRNEIKRRITRWRADWQRV